jgi:Contractile injection system tube protein
MTALAKAQLIELDQDFKKEKPGGEKVSVQFNPETLKVTFANALVQPQGGDNAAGNTGRQFVGAGTTKLALTLWFDVTAMTDKPVDDVRKLTQKVIHFMTPAPDGNDAKKMVPPSTRFVWGSFMFDGIVEGLEESLEFFAPDGKPLRASISLTIGQQKILTSKFGKENANSHKRPKTPGEKPLKVAKQGNIAGAFAGIGSALVGLQGQALKASLEDPLRAAAGSIIDVTERGLAPFADAFAPSIPAPKPAPGSRLGVN